MTLDGTYDITAKTPMGNQEGRLLFKTDGGSLTGTSESAGQAVELTGGVANGNEFQFKVKQKTPMGEMIVTFTGTVDGDAISGKIKTPLGPVPFEGKRVS
jgi:hypothetical protein